MTLMISECGPYQIADARTGSARLLATLRANHDFNLLPPAKWQPKPKPIVVPQPTTKLWFSVDEPWTAKEPQFQDIGRAVCQHFNLTKVRLRAKRRTKDITYPRQIAMYLGRELTRRSMPEIARLLGLRDHTTVLYGANKIAALVRADWKVAYDVAHVESRI